MAVRAGLYRADVSHEASENPGTYGSARDLPTVKELDREVSALNNLRPLLPRKVRQQMAALREELDALVSTIDDFYAALGPRNWIFHDSLNVESVRSLLEDSETDDEAEARLIAMYDDAAISFGTTRMRRFEVMRPRLDLLDRARKDHLEGRYYASVLVLLSVMDGFVNDVVQNPRRGLHAREPDELTAWDSVVGHHMGLAHAHKNFRKSFRRLQTDEVSDLFRHGIVHGMLTGYDNERVSAKAWNRLFALGDWADSHTRAQEPDTPQSGLREVLSDIARGSRRRRELDAWEPHEHPLADDDGHPLTATATQFLKAWKNRQYGPIAEFFYTPQQTDSPGRRAGLARDLYDDTRLVDFSLRKRTHIAASVAIVTADLTFGDTVETCELRWLHLDDNDRTALEGEPGSWRLCPYGPDVIRGGSWLSEAARNPAMARATRSGAPL
jgi:hypothetical protein